MKKLYIIIVAVFLGLSSNTYGQGCMEASDDGVTIIGFVQPQFNVDFAGVDNEGNSIDSKNSFLFNRARFGVTGTIPYDFSYYATFEFSPTLGGPYMLDVFVTYHGLGPWANFTLGQFKPPFGLELSTPCHMLHTINRSRVVNELASPFRDLGFMVWGGTGDKDLFNNGNENVIQWKLAIMNGTGLNTLDDNQGKDIVARLIFSPWRWVRLGGSYKYGKQKPAKEDLDEDTRTRYGADLELEFGNFLFQGEYIYGFDQGSTLEGGGCGQEPTVVIGDFKKSGYFAQAMYMTGIRLQPVIKFESYDSNMDKSDNLYSTVTVGLNYFFNDWTRLQVNYMYNDNQNPEKYYQQQFQIQVQAVIP